MKSIQNHNQYIFGPVPSRRLGRSLGVDLVPFKTCPLNCIYCEQGQTTFLTCEIKEWVPLEDVLKELKVRLESNPDFITLAGSGEPTLHSGIGDLIREIKKITSIPVAVLTNGVLFPDEKVRKRLIEADLVMPSLDAGDEQTFQIINRPATSLKFEEIVQGLIDFRNEFKNKYWLEVLLVKGVNTSEEQIARLADKVRKINPDKVILNTVTRPPSEIDAKPLSEEELISIACQFGAGVEVVPNVSRNVKESVKDVQEKEVVELLKRRPCSENDIVDGLHVSFIWVRQIIQKLIAEGKIEKYQLGSEEFYRISSRKN